MADQRAAIAALLEPDAVSALPGPYESVHQMDRLVAYSQAVSLRRIADALQPTTVENHTKFFSEIDPEVIRRAIWGEKS